MCAYLVFVVLFVGEMIFAIHFNDQFLFKADKVNDIIEYWMLPSETIPQLLASYYAP